MEAARTSSGSGTRHRRCRCCLPALTGFTTSRRGEADASHHGRARDGLHDVKTGKKPAPRRAGTRSYHIGADGNSPRSRALDFARIRRYGRRSNRARVGATSPRGLDYCARPITNTTDQPHTDLTRRPGVAGRRRKETPTRVGMRIDRDGRLESARVGGRRRSLAPKQLF